MVLTFLTPRLPPCVCGVSDHTQRLAEAMREFVSRVTAIVLHPRTEQLNDVFDRIDCWSRRPYELRALLREHETDLLWIQYSGYGFGYQGLPRYLIRAIESLHPRPTIVVYFHEIHCAPQQLGWKGRLLSPLQKRVGKSLAEAADVIFTSNELYRQVIHRDYAVPTNRIHEIPLGSNISVPALDEQIRQRWRDELGWRQQECVAVAFGSAGGQRRALTRNREALKTALHNGFVDRIVCIGGEAGTHGENVLAGIDDNIAVATTVLGNLSAENVAKCLLAADVALAAYPVERLGKSGVLMSYALAGLPVLVFDTVPTGPTSFREARLISWQDLPQLRRLATDLSARIDRQAAASALYSWTSIAGSAFNELRTLSPAIAPAPAVIGASP